MKYDILNRRTGAVQFTAEIECAESETDAAKIGLAVQWARKNGAAFSETNLRWANLSGANLSGADFSETDLSWADLGGADFSETNLSGADLSGADLGGADLSWADLCEANLSGANLRKANLSEANLREANLSEANLRWANFSETSLRGANLSGADLRGANFSETSLREAPKVENIHQKIYAAASRPGGLDMGHWHTCGTTHCWAGWAVALAGDAGAALEAEIGTPAAAALIFLRSDPGMESVPDFYCGNENALADMKARAE